MIVMGINRLPEIRDYWSTDEKMHNTFIASRITHDRFEQISRYLHLVNNTSLPSRNQPGYHRLQKVLPIITHMKQKCKENYNPHPQNSVDEAMIGYKGKNNNYHNFKCSQIHIYMHTGRSSMIQYMPMKPTKRGFKVWARADSVNGTLYAICVILFCSLCVPFVSWSCTQCTCMCVVTLFYVVHACMHIVCLLGFVMCVLSCWARSVDLHVVPDGNSTLCAG